MKKGLLIALGRPSEEPEGEDMDGDARAAGQAVLDAMESKDPVAIGRAIQQAIELLRGGEVE